MESILLVIHVIVALVIVGLIMLQQGKGAEMGASFGSGSSQTVFGAAGSGNFFSRMTAILVAVFFTTSLTLAVLSKERVAVEDEEIPVIEEIDEPMPSVVPADQAEEDVPEADIPAPTNNQDEAASDAEIPGAEQGADEKLGE